MSATCRSCGAPIEWAITAKGKRMPVDAEPRTDGTILLRHTRVGEPPRAEVLNAEEIAFERQVAANRGEELRLFVSHFVSCPQSADWRKDAA